MPTWVARLLSLIVPIVVDRFFRDLMRYIKELFDKKARQAKREEAAKKYMEVIQNPNSTREERKNAEDAFINS